MLHTHTHAHCSKDKGTLGQLFSFPERSSLVALRLFRSSTSVFPVARRAAVTLSTLLGAAVRQASTPGEEEGAPKKHLHPATPVHVSAQTV